MVSSMRDTVVKDSCSSLLSPMQAQEIIQILRQKKNICHSLSPPHLHKEASYSRSCLWCSSSCVLVFLQFFKNQSSLRQLQIGQRNGSGQGLYKPFYSAISLFKIAGTFLPMGKYTDTTYVDKTRKSSLRGWYRSEILLEEKTLLKFFPSSLPLLKLTSYWSCFYFFKKRENTQNITQHIIWLCRENWEKVMAQW